MGIVNGVDVDKIGPFAEAAKVSPNATFQVTSRWTGGGKSNHHVAGHTLFGKQFKRDFDIRADEPLELLGENTAPNPQDLLMAGLNACMMVGYTVNAAGMGIKLDKLEIDTEGTLDLRGFLGLDQSVKPGYEKVNYTVRIQADAPREKLEELHAHVQKTSPNYSNFASGIQMVPKLVVEKASKL